MNTSMSIFNCEAMTAALHHSLKIQLCRPSKLDCAMLQLQHYLQCMFNEAKSERKKTVLLS